jgi:hypothetical protein
MNDIQSVLGDGFLATHKIDLQKNDRHDERVCPVISARLETMVIFII